jgi:hypothetical protein
MTEDPAEAQSYRERLIKVFEFLKAYTELRFPTVRDIEQQLKILWLRDLPKHTSVEVHQNDPDLDVPENGDVILKVTRPSLTACPPPPAAIADWIKPGWENIENRVEFHVSRNIPDRKERARIERFEEVPERSALLTRWGNNVRSGGPTNGQRGDPWPFFRLFTNGLESTSARPSG